MKKKILIKHNYILEKKIYYFIENIVFMSCTDSKNQKRNNYIYEL